MSTRINLGDTVEVAWVDSMFTSGWIQEEDAIACIKYPDVEIKSLGFLFHRDKDYVVIGSHHSSHNDEWEALMRIPRGCIRSITLLRKKEKHVSRKSTGSHSTG